MKTGKLLKFHVLFLPIAMKILADGSNCAKTLKNRSYRAFKNNLFVPRLMLNVRLTEAIIEVESFLQSCSLNLLWLCSLVFIWVITTVSERNTQF